MNSSWTKQNGSAIDLVLGADIADQWNQLDEQFAGLHALAGSFVTPGPSNSITAQAYKCLGLAA